MLLAAFRFLGELILRLYPCGFRAEFAEEMREVFHDALEDAARQGIGPLLEVGLRELVQAPPAILRSMKYRPGEGMHGAGGSVEDLEKDELELGPPTLDGRQSWRQALLELVPFLAGGAALVLLTYLPFLAPEPGWQRMPGTLGMAMLLLPLPAFLFGAARGMPRWTYPFGGMLVGYCLYTAVQLHLVSYSVTLLALTTGLAYAAWVVDGRSRPLPRRLRQVFQSVRTDWTRCSFGLYGGMPLLVLIAYDNGILDNREPYLAISMFLTLCGALAYIRAKHPTRQILALLAGMTLSFWMALLDPASFFQGRPGWVVSAPQSWLAETAWMLPVWLAGLGILFLPVIFMLVKTGIGIARVRRIGGS